MNLERRLQHAARELREVTIDVPPLGRQVRRRRASLIPAFAAPLLFATGALFAVGAVRGVERPMQSDISVTTDLADDRVGAPVSDPVVESIVDVAPALVEKPTVADPATGADTGVTAPSIHDELQMISAFLAESEASHTADAADPESQPTDTVVGGPA